MTAWTLHQAMRLHEPDYSDTRPCLVTLNPYQHLQNEARSKLLARQC